MNKATYSCLLLLMVTLLPVSGQVKQKITLDDVFNLNQKSVYGINWMKDGSYYSSLAADPTPKVVKINLATGEETEVLIDGDKIGVDFTSYSLSEDERFALLSSKAERIYRRSSKAIFHVVSLNTGEVQPLLGEEKVSYASLSPDNTKVAFVKENNLYYKDLDKGTITQVTKDGAKNAIINGSADWVYEEEFSMAQAFAWSPDGKKLAFIRFDETAVPVFNMQLWGPLYPEDYLFKYPKAGEKNAAVSIHIFDLGSTKTVKVDSGNEEDIYLPRIFWTNDPETLAFIRLNRLQNQMDLLHADAKSGESRLILHEEAATYVDLDYNDNLYYLSDNKGFIATSEKDGYKHIYHYDINGTLIRQLTSGNWEVTSLVGIDEKKKVIYFESAEISPLERQLYVINLNGKGKKLLTTQPGTHATNMSPDFSYYINYHSTASQPLSVSLHEAGGKLIKVLETNEALVKQLGKLELGTKEFFTFSAEDGHELNGYLIKPYNFDPNQEYPLLLYVYGGPGSQNVRNAWGGLRDFWHQHLVAEGYIIACIDNRGTGGRGRDFKHMTYRNLGKLETADQIAAAKYLAEMDYIDESRVGIWGWSYGGYMSSLSLMLGNDVFKTAIAVAPVTTWRYYDTIYTERYLQTPQLNAAGYDDYSPISHVDKLQGNYLLIHGTGDDNVHFQNSVDLVDALIAADKQFESFYYPNRSHGISGGNTSRHLYQLMTNFLKRKL